MNVYENKHRAGCDCGFCKNQKRFKAKAPAATSESRLTTSARKKLASSDFAITEKRKFPFEDKAHARNALARAGHKGGDVEKHVKAAVHRKYPSIGENRAAAVVTRMLEDAGCIHDETDLSNPEEQREVEIGKEMLGLSKDLLHMHGQPAGEDGCCQCQCPHCDEQFDYRQHPETSADTVGCPSCGGPCTQEHIIGIEL